MHNRKFKIYSITSVYSNQENNSSQWKRVELIVDGTYYGKTKEGNYRASNVVLWNNKRREGFIANKDKENAKD